MSNEPLADVRDMYMVHTMLRRELGLAPALVRGVADHDVERATVVAEHLAIVDNLLDHHHRGEDANVWPRLLERAGAEAEPIVELMERQHAEIEKLPGETRDRLAEWRTTADARQGAGLADGISLLLVRLVEHLAVEEDRAIALMERHITAAEWAQAVAEGAADVPPEQMTLLFGMMAYEADPDTVRDIIATMPPEVSTVIGDLAAQAFAAHSERVHGTATPARIGARTDEAAR